MLPKSKAFKINLFACDFGVYGYYYDFCTENCVCYMSTCQVT